MKKKYLSPQAVKHLKIKLINSGHTAVSLAQLLGHPWSTVYGVLNGHKRTPATRAAIAQFFGMPEAELFPPPVGEQEAAAPAAAGLSLAHAVSSSAVSGANEGHHTPVAAGGKL